MTSPHHVPVLLDRVVALLAPALEHDGAVLVDCTLGLGGHTEAVLDALRAWPGWSASTATRRRWRSPASGWRRSATGSPASTPSTTSSPDVLRRPRPRRRSTRSCSTSASPPCSSTSRERGFAYAEDAPLDMRMDGTHRPAPPPTCSTPTRPRELTRILREYGEERFARKIAAAVVREREREPFTDVGPAGRAAVRRDPGAGPAYRRPPRQAHLPGAADGGQRRAGRAAPGASRPRSTRSRSAAGSSSSPTTRSRTGWSSRRSPRATAQRRPRRTCRSCPRAASRRCGW